MMIHSSSATLDTAAFVALLLHDSVVALPHLQQHPSTDFSLLFALLVVTEEEEKEVEEEAVVVTETSVEISV
jgi:hypothetical protein